MTIIPIAAMLTEPIVFSKKKDGTPMSAATLKQISCLFVRLNITLLFTFVRSRGTEIYDAGVMDNLTCIFDGVNMQVGAVASQVGTSPAAFQPAVFRLIQNLSENVITPIAGLILTFIACYELIQLVISHNNLANIETWIFFKWVFKTFIAVTLITNTIPDIKEDIESISPVEANALSCLRAMGAL